VLDTARRDIRQTVDVDVDVDLDLDVDFDVDMDLNGVATVDALAHHPASVG